MLVITHRLRPARSAVSQPPPVAPYTSKAAALARVASARRLAAIATLALFVQIVLGALVRHTGSALACLDIPFCKGELWPDAGLAQIHMVHRFGAVLAGLVVIAAAHAAMRAARGRVRLLAAATLLLLTAQIVLGLYSVLSLIAIPVVVAHLVVGALLLAAMLAVTLHLRDVQRALLAQAPAAASPQPADAGASSPQPAAGASSDDRGVLVAEAVRS